MSWTLRQGKLTELTGKTPKTVRKWDHHKHREWNVNVEDPKDTRRFVRQLLKELELPTKITYKDRKPVPVFYRLVRVGGTQPLYVAMPGRDKKGRLFPVWHYGRFDKQIPELDSADAPLKIRQKILEKDREHDITNLKPKPKPFIE